jgi:hypothetical protein
LQQQHENASLCQQELADELEDTRALCEMLQADLHAAKMDAARANDELQRQKELHKLEIQFLNREARDGAAKLQQTFSDAMQQHGDACKLEIETLHERLTSQSLELEKSRDAEQLSRRECDMVAAELTELNRFLAEEKESHLRQQNILQSAVLQLKTLVADLKDEMRCLVQEKQVMLLFCMNGFPQQYNSDAGSHCSARSAEVSVCRTEGVCRSRSSVAASRSAQEL